MKHAILGAGGVGGLVAGVLANGGEDVTLVVRPETVSAYPPRLRVERPSGTIEASAAVRSSLDSLVDVLWITVKAYQLPPALRGVPRSGAADTIVPLLNGLDHVALLRSHFTAGQVVPGTIAVEAERVAPGHIIQRSPFARVVLSATGEAQLSGVAGLFRAAGFTCEFQAGETAVLWSKLAFLAPFALVSTAADMNKEQFFADPEWRARLESAVREACAVAAGEGAPLDASKIFATLAALPGPMRSSMQKDVAAGRTPELDAIGGAIVRAGARHAVPVPVIQGLVATIGARAAASR